MTDHLRAVALGLAVGLVLADSSVVILALPDVLAQFSARIGPVSWVITGFNLALGLAAVPAAMLARRRGAGPVYLAGIGVFVVGSLVCAGAGSLEVLVSARVLQAVGGAAVVCAALELLPRVAGSERAAVAIWSAAGIAGAALGPAIGGALTQVFGWRSIFVLQAPLALVALAGLRRAPRSTALAVVEPPRRPHVAANLALALVSAALTGALFLLVLLLTEAWGLSPFRAAVTVTVMPACAALQSFVPARVASHRARAAAGALALAGGLAALAVVPGARAVWTIAPQVLIGLGMGLTVGALISTALAGRAPEAIHGGWTVAARHLGVVLGLLLITPLFTHDLTAQGAAAERAGVALLLDAKLDPSLKLDLAQAVGARISASHGRIPDVRPAFASVSPPASQVDELHRLESGLLEQVRRAATHAFSHSFLLCALLALVALVPIGLGRRVEL